ncbi:hypothetical protein LVY65_04315 [Sphingomonas sp. G124]|uniref:Uncharacterized protein n=1 Tax=Sphingomonas cremea TaxID=2904799 RepID=A0A9X1QJ09_9SPHN|nr:hypothetical protein [Sphingomonas cremea]MCF2514290.1 hypothetical protein [Sphingomonas cremea]
MGEPKAFASLSSGLLARKGAARPAMRPQGFGQGASGLEDLGWNDMGFEPPKPAIVPVRDEDHDAFGEELPDQPLRNPLAALTPIASPVHDQHAEIAERFAAHDENGEDEDGEYIDETAELYDPDAEDVEPIMAAASPEREPEPEPELVPEPAPVAVVAVPARAVAPVRPRRPRAAAGSKGKAAFTLRLDPARHLKLRLACAVNGRSAQQLVTDALDQLLNGMPELDSMAERAPRKRAEG